MYRVFNPVDTVFKLGWLLIWENKKCFFQKWTSSWYFNF